MVNEPSHKTSSDKKAIHMFVFAFLGLLVLLVLIIFARAVFFSAIDKTAGQYNQSAGLLATEQSTYGLPEVKIIDPIMGAQYADLTIVEFADFECSYCSDMSVVLNQIVDAYPNVRVVWKDLPSPLHINARSAASAARCAQEQDAFWVYHDYLFANQDNLTRDTYLSIAEVLGFDTEMFANCIDDQRYEELIQLGFEQADALDITSTPYLFVGDMRIDTAISYEALSQLLDSLLSN